MYIYSGGTGGDTATVSANYCGPKVVNIQKKDFVWKSGPSLTLYYHLLVTKRKGTGIRAVATLTLPSPGDECGKGFGWVNSGFH